MNYENSHKNIFMAIFIVLWSYLFTNELSCLQKNKSGHTNVRPTNFFCIMEPVKVLSNNIDQSDLWFKMALMTAIYRAVAWVKHVLFSQKAKLF